MNMLRAIFAQRILKRCTFQHRCMTGCRRGGPWSARCDTRGNPVRQAYVARDLRATHLRAKRGPSNLVALSGLWRRAAPARPLRNTLCLRPGVILCAGPPGWLRNEYVARGLRATHTCARGATHPILLHPGMDTPSVARPDTFAGFHGWPLSVRNTRRMATI